MELWDLYDKSRNKLGRTHIRGEKMEDGTYHLCVHVWLRNSEGLYLMSRRSPDRYSYPLKWECPGGSVTAGEDSLEGALREVYEEVGVRLDPEKGHVLFSKVRPNFNDLMDVWVFEYEGDAHLDRATTKEVCETAWMTRDQIYELYRTGDLVGTLDYFFCAFDREEPDYSDVIGLRVTGHIDRPMGSRHPRHPEMVYPVNYGYADGYTGGDGQPQDVYVLGPEEPIESFSGTVIAVIRRYNDCEDKWVVAPDGDAAAAKLTDDEIIGLTAFQEQFFYGKVYRK